MVELFRDEFILDYCKGKSVLHIGATDSPYHREKAEKGELLHQKLQKVCKQLIGLDIDKKAIKILKDEFNIKDIYFGDIIKGKYELNLNKYKFDYILFADVIEHLDNPGTALVNLKKFMNNKTRMIITTPNVFQHCNFMTYFTGVENVHPDHTFWPSYKTMCKLIENNG